jgi:general secretion pathway protein K
VIYLDPLWSDEFTFPIEGGGIQAQLVDMQACFNLNGLKDKTANTENAFTRSPELTARLAAFDRLLALIEPQIPSFEAETVRDSLADWLDADDNMSQLGAEDSVYEGQQFPYMAANNFMSDKSELRLVNGVQATWLQALLKWVCVLPGDDLFKLNVNTVTEENAAVLAAITGVSLSDATSIIGSRPPEGFKSADEFLALSQLAALNLSTEQKAWFDVTTQYFMLSTKTRYNNASFAMQTLFKVDDQRVNIRKRQFGIQ